ncbi:hypothetical protein ACF1G5_20470 [Streptomyces coeruleorubidus]|uniref:hypothetical protein n=1 Tax=Streptomyces coeruleorubidus TaxID=116188 RepID=UPI0036F8D374
MLQDLPVFTRAARAAFRGTVAGVVVAIPLGLGLWSVATTGAPTVARADSDVLYVGDVGWNGAKAGLPS